MIDSDKLMAWLRQRATSYVEEADAESRVPDMAAEYRAYGRHLAMREVMDAVAADRFAPDESTERQKEQAKMAWELFRGAWPRTGETIESLLNKAFASAHAFLYERERRQAETKPSARSTAKSSMAPPTTARLASRCRVPVRAVVPGGAVPASIEDTAGWISQFDESRARIDPAAAGRSEGVVLRTADRSKICKLRFEDYARTLRARAMAQR